MFSCQELHFLSAKDWLWPLLYFLAWFFITSLGVRRFRFLRIWRFRFIKLQQLQKGIINSFSVKLQNKMCKHLKYSTNIVGKIHTGLMSPFHMTCTAKNPITHGTIYRSAGWNETIDKHIIKSDGVKTKKWKNKKEYSDQQKH